jgi:hypothetical protein
MTLRFVIAFWAFDLKYWIQNKPNSLQNFRQTPKFETQNPKYSQILTNINKYSHKGEKLRLNYLLFITISCSIPNFTIFICIYSIQIILN